MCPEGHKNFTPQGELEGKPIPKIDFIGIKQGADNVTGNPLTLLHESAEDLWV